MENKVINVQMDEETFNKFQSGGGNAGGGALKYYVAPEQGRILVASFAALLKLDIEGNILIAPPSVYMMETDDISSIQDKYKAFAVDASLEISELTGGIGFFTIGDMMERAGVSLSSLTEITKEEFYNLNA